MHNFVQHVPTPKRPHFIFGKRMWEIESECIPILGGGLRTEVTFEHIFKTGTIDTDVASYEKGEGVCGVALTIIETVFVSINGEFNEPKISIYTRNTGTMVEKDRGERTIKEIEPLGLENYIIQKLMHEAIKIDDRNRDNLKKEL